MSAPNGVRLPDGDATSRRRRPCASSWGCSIAASNASRDESSSRNHTPSRPGSHRAATAIQSPCKRVTISSRDTACISASRAAACSQLDSRTGSMPGAIHAADRTVSSMPIASRRYIGSPRRASPRTLAGWMQSRGASVEHRCSAPPASTSSRGCAARAAQGVATSTNSATRRARGVMRRSSACMPSVASAKPALDAIAHAAVSTSPMPKPRQHVRHIGRTYYLSESWNE